ncbi:D-Ala-D-Ala dipeptidase vanX. Metallo peptidase. MEROPS family M15D [Gillisia sp. Hel1_33_143]|uniref:M15 family metallopeptidase n=1 Tax=Gillisia sp. Hel1_33_143 TaxID=1336796 RepID=UPI00087B8C40|nr:M15 family metallopeptidase [Gillisia sp. Hel1_33_143]SDS14382.1 D-Ala-D-Ala dipeptidase vanX. Metallo peptidase. MEROPS family M15D [Gillisia sp. Hel1_33_143]
MKHIVFLISLFTITNLQICNENAVPKEFVKVKQVIPDIQVDLRYAGTHNFVGRPLPGYNEAEVILTKQAAEALKNVQLELEARGLCLKIFDAYRPQRAVNYFIEWAKKPEDTIGKEEFYPEQDKRNLFNLGYIATRSGHSRGSTIDLTIIDANTLEELDMGGTYDFFGEVSHLYTTSITAKQHKNRELLKLVMSRNGFRSYSEEWWHFTLRGEPFPNTYFDFVIQ